MSLYSIIILNTYSIILLTVIGVQTSKHAERKARQYRLYMLLLQMTVLFLIVDVIARLDGYGQAFYPFLNQTGNFLLFLINPSLATIWFFYAYFQLYDDTKKIKIPLYFILGGNFINAVLLVMTQFYGWYYYIDNNNVYHRGSIFEVSLLIVLALLFVTFVLIIKNRSKLEKEMYNALLFFAVPPIIGSLLQTLFYGTSFVSSSMSISLLIVFLNIQNRNIYSDYLTGVHNRKKLELYLKEKVEKCGRQRVFSAILMDFNDFKKINDTYGHKMGDDALVTSVALMKDCLKPNDFISRYGGDEFCIVLDMSDKQELERIANKIRDHMNAYNETGVKPYKINFSMGYAVYDCDANIGMEEFQKEIDERMYSNKKL